MIDLSGLPTIQYRLLQLALIIVCVSAIIVVARSLNDRRRRSKGLPSGKRGGTSEQVQMDSLAYGSRMVSWSPLGKLFLVLALIVAGLITKSAVVPVITFFIGLVLMAYSTNLRIPSLLALAIGEAMLIMIIGCGMISIMGSASDPAIWDSKILWFSIHMTAASFNQAWLVFFRAIAGVTLMLAFASSTPIPHLAQALRQLRIPREITEIVVLIYRYSFLLLERMQTMYSSASGRLGFNGFMRSMKTTAGIAVGIFTSSMEMGDKAQTALECRNYTGEFPIFRKPKPISVTQIALPLFLAICMVLLGTVTEGLLQFDVFFFGGA